MRVGARDDEGKESKGKNYSNDRRNRRWGQSMAKARTEVAKANAAVMMGRIRRRVRQGVRGEEYRGQER